MESHNFWKFITGYVIIKIQGKRPESFLNVCKKNDLSLWNIMNNEDRSVSACMSLKSVKRIRELARKSDCNIKFIGRYGLPFKKKAIIGKKFFIAGILISILILIISMQFVWQVRLLSNKRIDDQALLIALQQNGVKAGVLKSKINKEQCETNIRASFPELTWVKLKVTGTVVTLEYSIGRTPPDLLPDHVPCDIVARKAGIIESVTARMGDIKVSPGESVEKGQVLISGNIMSTIPGDESTLLETIHSYGNVFATTYYQANAIVKNLDIQDEEAAVKETVKELQQKLYEEIPKGTIIKDVDISQYKDKDNKMNVNVTIKCKEEIGVTQSIEKIESTQPPATDTH